jgi:hypothetical protein
VLLRFLLSAKVGGFLGAEGGFLGAKAVTTLSEILVYYVTVT